MPYFVASLVFAAIHGALFSFISVYLVESQYKWISFFFVSYSVGAILVRIFFGHLIDKISKAFIITASFIAYGCAILILILFTTSYVVLFSAFLLGVSHGFLYPVLNTGIIKIIGEKKHGTGTNIFFFAFDTGVGIAPFLFGYLSGYLGYKFSFLIMAILLLLFSTTVYRPLKRVSC
jgi:MFS family permease